MIYKAILPLDNQLYALYREDQKEWEWGGEGGEEKITVSIIINFFYDKNKHERQFWCDTKIVFAQKLRRLNECLRVGTEWYLLWSWLAE